MRVHTGEPAARASRRLNAAAFTVGREVFFGRDRFQPDSALSRWYVRRFANGGSRARRVGIVALARRLLVVLWRYLESGVLPEGAQLKAV